MTSPEPKLRAQVVGDDIIVTLPGSHYSVTYYKPYNSPQLLAKRIPDTVDLRIPMTVSEFLPKAWRLANDEGARLGRVKVGPAPLFQTQDLREMANSDTKLHWVTFVAEYKDSTKVAS